MASTILQCQAVHDFEFSGVNSRWIKNNDTLQEYLIEAHSRGAGRTMRRNWYDLQWSFILLLLQQVWYSSCTTEYRRCRHSTTPTSNTSNQTVPPLHSLALHELYQSTCEECPEIPISESGSSTLTILSNKTRAVIYLTHPATLQKSLVLAAGLLTSGSRVTIVTGPHTPDQSRIRRVLFQHVPCAKHVVASILLTFHRLPIEASQLCAPIANDPTQSSGDVLLCSIQHAVETVEAMHRDLFVTALPGVFIMDASFVAGLLLSEQQRIPAILLMEHAETYLRPVLGAAAQESHRTSWSLRVWLRTAWTGLHDRFNALDLTSSFVALNRVRSKLKLGRVRRLSDVWQAGGNVMISSDPQALSWQSALPTVRILVDPLIPPCIPCLYSNQSSANDALPVVLVTVDNPSTPMSRFRSRRLLQALELARTSIRDLAALESCHTDDFCWNSWLDFIVVGPTSWMEQHLAPDFVRTEDTNFLDSLVRHQPVATVSSCDTTSSWTLSLGPPVLCVDATWSPREIAFRILNLPSSRRAGRAPPSPPFESVGNGLERIVTIIEQVGLLHDQYHKSWVTGWDMNQQLTRDLSHMNATEQQHETEETLGSVESILILLSWTICAATTIFVLVKDSSAMHKWRLRRAHRHYLTALVWTMADELNFVLSMWSEWAQEQWCQFDVGDTSVETRESHEPPGQSKRKRHPTKKRH